MVGLCSVTHGISVVNGVSHLISHGIPETAWKSITEMFTPTVKAVGFSADGRVPLSADLTQILVRDRRLANSARMVLCWGATASSRVDEILG